LVFINQRLNLKLWAGGESLADGFDGAVLQRDRPERARSKHACRFWEKDHMSPIDVAQVSSSSVEVGEEVIQILGDEVPGGPMIRLKHIYNF
jgi:hypothetical protein